MKRQHAAFRRLPSPFAAFYGGGWGAGKAKTEQSAGRRPQQARLPRSPKTRARLDAIFEIHMNTRTTFKRRERRAPKAERRRAGGRRSNDGMIRRLNDVWLTWSFQFAVVRYTAAPMKGIILAGGA